MWFLTGLLCANHTDYSMYTNVIAPCGPADVISHLSGGKTVWTPWRRKRFAAMWKKKILRLLIPRADVTAKEKKLEGFM